MHCSMLHCSKECCSVMAAKIETFIDALLGPFIRELERMPASAFRHLLSIY